MTEEKKRVFDANAAALLVKELHESFITRKTKSYEWRVSQLKGIERMVKEKEKEIVEALYKDLSKSELETFVSENADFYDQIFLYLGAERIETVDEARKALSVDPVIGAIAAGNAVVLKPSEVAPATSSLLAKLFEEYLDRTVVRVVEGAASETTALLEQKWDKIFYTGSARVGRIVMTSVAKHLTPVVLELGGKCPAVVDPDVNLQVAAKRIIAGKWLLNNGQACTAVDYIITTKAFAPKLIDALKEKLKQFFGENPMESTDLSRIVNSSHFKRLERTLDEEKVFNKVVVGGQRDQNKLKIVPTIFLDVPEDSLLMQDEIFGPLLPIVTVEHVKESIDFINSKPKPLVAYLFSNKEKLRGDFVQNVSSGGMVINDTSLHAAVLTLPFGGVGESGMGSYHGKFSFDAFSHKKAVLYREFMGDASIRYPPFTPRKQMLIKALIRGDIFGVILALLGWSRD